jgi:hypothetical protein
MRMTWSALVLVAGAADPVPMPEMYAVALTAPRETKSTRDAFDAFIRRVQELGQEGRAGRLVLRFGETGNALGGVCVEFVDDPTAQETLKPLRSATGVEIRKEKCM